MLEIRNASGLTLQLPPDQHLTVEINSTIFDTDDVIRGSYSYPFKFGLNENNRMFIGNGHLPESLEDPDMQVSVSAGVHKFVATLTYKTAGLFADAALLIDLGELAEKIKNIPLREFVTDSFFVGTNETGNTATLLKLATAEPNVYPVVFPPFHNADMVEEDWRPLNSGNQPITSYKRPKISNVYYPGNPGSYSGTLYGSGDRLLVPMVYVCWLIGHICMKLGFTSSGSLFTDPALSRLIIFNTQTTPGLNVDTTGYTVEIGRHLGSETITDFFKAIRSYIGVSIDINLTSRKAIFNTYKSLASGSDYVDFTASVVAGSLEVENSRKGFNIKTFVDSSDKYVKYSPYPVDVNNIRPKELQTDFSFSVGRQYQDVSLSIGTLRMDTFKSMGNENGPDWLIPAAHQPGNLADPFFEKSANYSPYFDPNSTGTVPEAKNSWALRFLIYWGMKQDTAGNLYPYASSVSYDVKYRVFAGLSLQPGEPDDIWHRYQKPYYEFLAYSKKISTVLKLNQSRLSEMSPSTPVGFALPNFVFGKYLLEKLTYELKTSQVYALAKFEGRQLVPKLLRAQSSLDASLITNWVQLAIENFQIVPNHNNSQNTLYMDVVAYVWEDGLYQVPQDGLGFQCNYKRCITDYDVNSSATTVCTKESTYISGHRTVIESHVVGMISGNPRGLIKFVSWAIMDGEGYRAR